MPRKEDPFINNLLNVWLNDMMRTSGKTKADIGTCA